MSEEILWKGEEGWASAHVKPRPQHPGAMLVDLQALDVVVGQGEAGRRADGEGADEGLRRDRAAEGFARDHQGAGVGDEREQDGEVAGDAVEEHGFVPDFGRELQNDEEAGGWVGVSVAGGKVHRIWKGICLRRMVNRCRRMPMA